ncbi:hypothetical protein KKD60_05750 [Patescibacteria group bacterium]|nr:hypothetical protein [Patescibacteria group bacterium]
MVAGFFLNKAKIGTDLFLIEAKNKKNAKSSRSVSFNAGMIGVGCYR